MISVSLFPGLMGFALLFISIGVFGIFYLVEMQTADPILNAVLFKENKTFTLSNLAALINYSAT
jgi:hypothetical protein